MRGRRRPVGRGGLNRLASPAVLAPAASQPVGAASPQASTGATSRDPLRWVLAVLIVLTTSRFHQHYSFLAAARPAMLIVAATGVFAVLNPKALKPENLTREWPMRIVTALAVVACFSVLFGISQGRAGKFFLETYWKVLLGAFLVAAAVRSARDLSMFIWAYVAGSGVLSFFSLFVFKPQKTDYGMVRLGDGYTYDANDIGCVLMIGLPLTMLTFQTSRLLGKIVSAFVLVGIGMTIALSGSRGAFLGLVVTSVWLLVMLRQVSIVSRLAFVAVVGVALTLKAPEGYWDQMRTITSPTEDYNWTAVDGRKQVAERGIEYLKAYPIFGIGVSNFPMAEGTISTKAQRHVAGTGLKWSAAHNSHLEVAAEMGIPGLILWAWLILGGIAAMTRLRSRFPDHWSRGDFESRFLFYATVYLPAALVSFAVTAAFVSFAYNDQIYLLAAYMAGVCGITRARAAMAHLPPHPVASTGRVVGRGTSPVARAASGRA